MPSETQRQRELDLYRLVDTLPEAAYDDIARLASTLCGAPIALVTLIDRDRQWFKARHGLDLAETSRDIAFCDHAIRQPDSLFEVADATGDARFSTNPLVTGSPGIRFYAGMPLVTPSGAAVGTVCVIDRAPRSLDETQRAALASLARLTINMMEGARRLRELERARLFDASVRAEPSGGTSAANVQPYAIAILQLQDFARLTGLLGERAVERTLREADRLLESTLAPGDSLDRVTGSGEYALLLHGEDPETRLAALLARTAVLENELGARVLHGFAAAASPDESPEAVYLRADVALSAARDAAQRH